MQLKLYLSGCAAKFNIDENKLNEFKNITPKHIYIYAFKVGYFD
jgi:hypothetical protein